MINNSWKKSCHSPADTQGMIDVLKQSEMERNIENLNGATVNRKLNKQFKKKEAKELKEQLQTKN